MKMYLKVWQLDIMPLPQIWQIYTHEKHLTVPEILVMEDYNSKIMKKSQTSPDDLAPVGFLFILADGTY